MSANVGCGLAKEGRIKGLETPAKMAKDVEMIKNNFLFHSLKTETHAKSPQCSVSLWTRSSVASVVT